MSYKDRLQPQITLTSPDGTVFTAKWVGNTRSQEKSIARFKTPGVKGEIIQDLEVSAASYPLTIYFDGADHDLDADKFYRACAERGEWSVVHPVHGTKTLQFISVAEAVQPVESGKVTEVTIDAIEVTLPSAVASTQQLAATVQAQKQTVNSGQVDQLKNTATLDTADKVSKFKTAVRKINASFDKTLKKITDKSAQFTARVERIQRGIEDELDKLDTSLADIRGIAASIQEIVQIPARLEAQLNATQAEISALIVEKRTQYNEFVADVLSQIPTELLPSEKNTAAVQETAVVAAVVSVADFSTQDELGSRSEALGLIENILSLFDYVTDGLDDAQILFSGETLSNAYFSQSETYTDTSLIVAQTLAYLVKASFDLAVEKKITMQKPEHPVMVALREYKTADGIDRFYDENKLTGSECLQLQTGRVVSVYL